MKKSIFQYISKFCPYILGFLIIFFVLLSFFLCKKINTLQANLKYSEKETDRLKDHINELSDYYRNPQKYQPTPNPTPIELKYFPQEGIKYDLSCYDNQKNIPPEQLTKNIITKLDKKEEIISLCSNLSENKIVFMTKKQTTDMRFYENNIKLFDNKTNQIVLLKTIPPNRFGACSSITGWNQNEDIYYACVAGDGPWVNNDIYKYNINSNEDGIIKSCHSFMEKENCTTYCDNTHYCQSDSFCDMATNNCRHYCQTYNDCVKSACNYYGPVRGCSE